MGHILCLKIYPGMLTFQEQDPPQDSQIIELAQWSWLASSGMIEGKGCLGQVTYEFSTEQVFSLSA